MGRKEGKRKELLDLAAMCLEQARAASTPEVAAELRRMAGEYGQRAAKLEVETPDEE